MSCGWKKQWILSHGSFLLGWHTIAWALFHVHAGVVVVVVVAVVGGDDCDRPPRLPHEKNGIERHHHYWWTMPNDFPPSYYHHWANDAVAVNVNVNVNVEDVSVNVHDHPTIDASIVAQHFLHAWTTRMNRLTPAQTTPATRPHPARPYRHPRTAVSILVVVNAVVVVVGTSLWWV
jgi:hypothetical protein